MVKTIFVTGASRGIGLAVTQYLINASHNVVLLARNDGPLQELKTKHPKQVDVVAADLGDFTVAQKTVDTTLERFGRIDGLVFNHGTLEPVSRVAASDPEAWRKGFDVNFFSAVAWVTAILPALRDTGGRIIFTSSGAAINAYTGWGAYGASKAALNHLALTLGAEEPGVTTISIRPGVVDTDMQRDIREIHGPLMKEHDVARFNTLHREGGLLRPEQPGHVIARLVLDAPKELTGRFLSWNDKDLASFQQ